MKKALSISFFQSSSKMLHMGKQSTVIQLTNGDVLKIFNPDFLDFLAKEGVSFENKILDSQRANTIPEIVKPKVITYGLDGQFEGYTMGEVKGMTLADYVIRNLSKPEVNLEEIANIYKKIEDAVKQDENIIFPDLCTLANTYILENGDIRFIDFDGIQIDKHRSPSLSSGLGTRDFIDQNILWNPKYTEKDGRYKKNLDKRSLAFIYFLMVFGVNLSTVGKYSEDLNRVITINDIIYSAGITDVEFVQKILDLFYSKKDDQYLGDDVFRLADKYKIETVPLEGVKEKKNTKILVRK
jgi:hypothetical protein